MKVKDLIKELSIKDPESMVILSSDPEGNSYSPVSDITMELYIKNSSWDGEVVHPDDVESHEGEELFSVVCMWPTN